MSRAVRLVAAIAALLALRARPAHAACTDDAYVRELVATGDAFRAVSVLKEAEFRARGTEQGFGCARMLLGLYLHHREYELADGWLARMLDAYPQARAMAPRPRLTAEMALLFGNAAEVRSRLAAGGVAATEGGGADVLLTFAAALGSPGQPPLIACSAPACRELARIYDRPQARARKSTPLALVLGLVPGLGQVYAGRVLAGVGSFLLNGALAGVTAYAVVRDERAAAVAFGTVGAALYLGNLYAGWEAARRENERRDAEVVAQIRAVPLELRVLELAR